MAYKSRLDRQRYARAHYDANRDTYLARTADLAGQGRAVVRAAKDRPCADCEVPYPFYVMQFDHRPGEIKLFTIGGVGTRSLTALRQEIAKCDVVCSNCHAERTWQRLQQATADDAGEAIIPADNGLTLF